MAIAKVVEVISEGETVEAAVEAAVAEASKSIRNIKGVYVEGIKAIVDNNTIVTYRVDCKITFLVE